MNESKNERLIKALERGITYERYGPDAGEPEVCEAEETMQEAADEIKYLESKLQEAIELLSESDGECPWREGTTQYQEYWNHRKYFVERVTNERNKEKPMGSSSGTG